MPADGSLQWPVVLKGMIFGLAYGPVAISDGWLCQPAITWDKASPHAETCLMIVAHG
jgi:hypothetical protein